MVYDDVSTELDNKPTEGYSGLSWDTAFLLLCESILGHRVDAVLSSQFYPNRI